MSVLRFRYMGKRQHAGVSHKMSLSSVTQIGARASASTGKANTLPARMQPPDFNNCQTFADIEPSSPISNKGSK